MNGEHEEILYRLDERTEHIQTTVDALDDKTSNQEEIIKENTARSKKNQTKLNTGIWVIGAAITALFAKVADILHL